ncbi:MAG: thioredoxin domain-containing protein [Candidatus Dormibacteria bacterium]
MTNRLAEETSPYLRQHADNPVDWYPWGDEALTRARQEDHPILLSVGYSACHWCHVMAHESFENPAVAALMNENFVNIKVDREERPDIDSIYMQAVQAMTGQGGWPMTVFLTPDGRPFLGGTYFPPVDRHGMKGFPTILRAAADVYRQRRGEVDQAAEELTRVLDVPRLRADGAPSLDQVRCAVDALVEEADLDMGGFSRSPKFPHPAAIDLLLRRFRQADHIEAFQAASITLDAMAGGGVYDQIGGGFHRYSVDNTWTVPHFEKMLYDNAQLVTVYLHGFQVSGRERWRRIVTDTVDYLLREMRLPGGAFSSSQDADSEGEEGRFFVWTPAQVRAVCDNNDDVELALRLWGISDGGNFEHGSTILTLPVGLEQLAAELDVPVEEMRHRVDSLRLRLREARERRVHPGRDDKVLTSWNALTIRALAEAGAVLGRADYVDAAERCADFLLDNLTDFGVLLRSWRDGQAKITGFLEDVAFLGDALLVLYEATGRARYFEKALFLANDIVARFHVPGVGLYDTASGTETLLVRPRSLDDNPIPAGPSIAAQLFLRLHAFTGDGAWHDRAMEILAPLAGAIGRVPLAVANAAAALELALSAPREVAVVGDRDDEATRALVDAVWQHYDPLRVLAWGAVETVPLLANRPLVEGRAAAYVCEQFACQAPVTGVAALQAALAGPA